MFFDTQRKRSRWRRACLCRCRTSHLTRSRSWRVRPSRRRSARSRPASPSRRRRHPSSGATAVGRRHSVRSSKVRRIWRRSSPSRWVGVLSCKKSMIRAPFKCYIMQWGGGGVPNSPEKCCQGVHVNIISVTRGWVGVQFPEKKRYVALEWRPLSANGGENNLERRRSEEADL